MIECEKPVNEGAIYLNNKDRKELEQWYFTSFTQCKKLNLRELGIEKIGPGAFVHLEEVWYLHLGKNHLQRIRQGMLSGLRSLRVLKLTDNMISAIQPDSFLGMDSLKELVLRNNMISKLKPGALNGLRHLEILDLSNNLLSMLSEDVLDPHLLHEITVGSEESLSLYLQDNPIQCRRDMCWIKRGIENNFGVLLLEIVPCDDISGQKLYQYLESVQC